MVQKNAADAETIERYDIEILKSLLCKVEELSSPCREIDQDLYSEIGGCPFDKDGMQSAYRAPPVTASLDAAVALIERALPAREWQVGLYMGETGQACLRTPHSDEVDVVFSQTPALALIAVMLRALIAQTESKNGTVSSELVGTDGGMPLSSPQSTGGYPLPCT